MNLYSPSTVKELLDSFGLAPRKSYGQNFLINPSVTERIAASCGSTEAVLEIGPGIGTLTCELCEICDKVVAVEIDRGLMEVLKITLADYDNVKVINEDFMKKDIVALYRDEFAGRRPAVCANLPYYITTPIVMKLLEEGRDENGKSLFHSITIMIQSEVADRFCAQAGDSEYGSITASIAYYGSPKKLFTVPAGNFYPAPKVSSTVMRIDLYDTPPYSVKNETFLFKLIAAAFSQRRKTFVNSVASSYSHLGKDRIVQALENVGLRADIRGESISIEQFCALSDLLCEN